jgi:hypothetical protein
VARARVPIDEQQAATIADGVASPADGVPTEATSNERRAFLAVGGLLNVVFLIVDVFHGWPHPALVVGARVLLTALLVGVPLALKPARPDAVVRTWARVLAAGSALSLGALVWATDGFGGFYFIFLAVAPIAFTMAVPDDPPAAILMGGIGSVLGLGRAVFEGATPEQLALWSAAFLGLAGYAAVGAVVRRRLRAREVGAREELRLRDRERARGDAERELLARRLEAIRQQGTCR